MRNAKGFKGGEGMNARLASLAAIVLIASVGCGGGSKQVGDPLTLGRSAMYEMASGDTIVAHGNLGTALRMFEQAMRAQPDSSEAKLWAAVCLVGLAGMDISGVVASPPTDVEPGSGPVWSEGGGGDGWIAPDPGDGTVPGAPPDHEGPVPPVEPPHRIGLIWNLRYAIANPFTLLNVLAPVADIRMGLPGVLGFWADDPQAHMDTLARLDRADQLLSEVEADADFSMTLPDPDRDGATLRVELPEVHLFHAYVHSLRAEVALALAYVRDAGPRIPMAFLEDAPDSPDAWNPFGSLDRNGDGLLTPDEYLPADPFLTLRSAAYLQNARDAMTSAADHGRKGCQGVLARTDPTGYLINNVSPYREAMQEMLDKSAPLLEQAAHGPVEVLVPRFEFPADAANGSGGRVEPCAREGRTTFDLDPDPGDCIGWGPPVIVMRTVRINLAAWFEAPPADLKAFAPTIGLTSEGWPAFDSIKLPDPTFAGLFPDGVSADDYLYGPVIPMPLAGSSRPSP